MYIVKKILNKVLVPFILLMLTNVLFGVVYLIFCNQSDDWNGMDDQNDSLSVKLFKRVYFSMTTLSTVGYGDITPITNLGKVLAALTMFLGIGMFALPAAILASAYYEEIQKRNFLISLETISKIPLFENLPVGAIGKINSKLHALLVPPHKTIISKGENSDAMYIIEFGAVEVELEKPVILSTGDYFGERGLLLNEKRNATISSKVETKLLKLNKNDLLELMSEHETLFKELAHSSATRSGNNK